MWWIWALLFGLVLTWGFEIRIKDLTNRIPELENSINGLRDDVAKLKKDLSRPSL